MKGKSIPSELRDKIMEALSGVIGRIPSSGEIQSDNPLSRACHLANSAAARAALLAGSLALPPGPLGLLTILPDLVGVWRIQSQMVADIAAVFGKKAFLSKKTMLYCLFKHAAAQLARDLLIRVGERVLVRRASLQIVQKVLRKVSVSVAQRVIGKGISRWLPIVGAVGVGAYAYYDTAQVGKTAIEFFQMNLEDETEGSTTLTTT
jgi:hypothetical protein